MLRATWALVPTPLGTWSKAMSQFPPLHKEKRSHRVTLSITDGKDMAATEAQVGAQVPMFAPGFLGNGSFHFTGLWEVKGNISFKCYFSL